MRGLFSGSCHAPYSIMYLRKQNSFWEFIKKGGEKSPPLTQQRGISPGEIPRAAGASGNGIGNTDGAGMTKEESA